MASSPDTRSPCSAPKGFVETLKPLPANVVREAGLDGGWVDFKVCSVDETWSGLAFKRRK